MPAPDAVAVTLSEVEEPGLALVRVADNPIGLAPLKHLLTWSAQDERGDRLVHLAHLLADLQNAIGFVPLGPGPVEQLAQQTGIRSKANDSPRLPYERIWLCDALNSPLHFITEHA